MLDYYLSVAPVMPADTTHGMIYAVCLTTMAISAGLYPVMCLWALRGRGAIGAAAIAVLLGSAGLLSGAVLGGIWHWAAVASLVYFGGVGALVTIYLIARIAALSAMRRRHRMASPTGSTRSDDGDTSPNN